MDNTELMHHGIKGMKWGVRKDKFVDAWRRQNRTKKTSKQDKESLEKMRSAKSKYDNARVTWVTEGLKLFDAGGKRAEKDFNSFHDIDDYEYFEYVSRTEYGLDTTKYNKATKDMDSAYKEFRDTMPAYKRSNAVHHSSIKGRKWVESIDKESTLQHHGTKGMKWGVRRYQNKDGSLTAAGKARYDRDVRENNAKVKDKRIKLDPDDNTGNAKRWAKEDMTRAKKTIDNTSELNKQMKNLNNTIPRKQTRETVDLSHMTDQELRDKINRANLERQYNDIVNPPRVSKGREHVDKVLEYGGTALAITGSALGVALAIKELLD